MDEEVLRDTEGKLDDDIDALFKLALPEFTGARNDLAARLKREGRANDANLVKALAKPSVSAWAVNQLYWKHRQAFDRLLATSQHIRQAQSSQTAGRIADMRGSLDARSEALTQLTDLATALLRDAGHNPAPDALHRITTTLEALSAYATLSGGPTPGRLTQDVDPPGFGSLASLIPAKGNDKLTKVTSGTKTRQRESPAPAKQQLEETRQAKIAAAKVLMQEAKKSVTEARSRTQRLEAAKTKAHAEARQAEKRLREAEGRVKKASAASQDAADRAQRTSAEAEAAAQALEDAERTLEKASKELEALVQN